ncbi:DUF982 domain-containing protein [Rhizobium sp. TRM96647]|uniref:DUF982 domain-containing protein n=1 Tax=unclassified Rhizobium TaxID=2613769 RepID=UPI003994B812
MDDPRYWTKYVELELGGPGRFLRVRSTRDALACLEHWPPERGAAYSEAVRVCRAVLTRGVPRKVARDAFIYAAREAGIQIRQR